MTPHTSMIRAQSRATFLATSVLLMLPYQFAHAMTDGEKVVATAAVASSMKNARACFEGTRTIIGLHALREKGVPKAQAVAFYAERGGLNADSQELIEVAYSVNDLTDERVAEQYEKCVASAQAELTESYAR